VIATSVDALSVVESCASNHLAKKSMSSIGVKFARFGLYCGCCSTCHL